MDIAMNNEYISSFIKKVDDEKLGVYGICVRKDGEVIANHRWRSDDRVLLYSISKSFTSVAIGMLYDEGLLTLDEKIAPLFSESIAALHDNAIATDSKVADITIRHLLTMSTGHEEGFLFTIDEYTSQYKSYAEYCFAHPLKYAPGEHYQYSNACSYLLSAIVTKKTGMTLLDFLKPRLFKVLNIVNPQWFTCPDGISLGGTGLHLKTEELSRFGQMLADGGVYNGTRVVSKEYIDMASSPQIKSNEARAYSSMYGLHFWPCVPGVFRADGLYAQFCVVVSEKHLAIAVTSHEETRGDVILTSIIEDIVPQF